MPGATIHYQVNVRDDNGERTLGDASIGVPAPGVFLGDVYSTDVVLLPNEWASLGGTGSFVSTTKLIVVVADQSGVMLEVTTDDGDDVGTVIQTYQLQANLPFILASNVSWANYAVNFTAGTLDIIDRMRAQNLGSANALVTVYALS